MDDAPDAGLGAGVEQGAGAVDLHRLHVVAPAVLQHSDAVHDCSDIGEQRAPGVGGREPREVGLDPLRVRQTPSRLLDGPAGGDQLMSR